MKKIISIILIIFIFTSFFTIETFASETSSTDISTEETFETYNVKITASSLRVRTGAGTNYKQVGSLARNKVTTVYDESTNGWLKIKYNGQYRWICGSYTKKMTSTSSSSGGTTTTGKVQITASTLNVRSGAGTSYKVITTVKKNNVYSYTATKKVSSTTWYKITVGSKTGWISGKYTKKPSSSSAPSTPTSFKKFKLTASERNYIERVVAAEARGEKYGKVTGEWGTTYDGMVVVAQTIYDRAVYSKGWKNTPYGVASRSGHFASPYKGKVSKEVKAAVSAVFDYGYRAYKEPIHYFCTRNCYPDWIKSVKYIDTIGNHKLYRKWS